MKSYPQTYKEQQPCPCGKICLSKRSAQTKANSFHARGNARFMRIYPCPRSNMWHLSNADKSRRHLTLVRKTDDERS